jgi:Uncharacterised BCR, YnfA/UPF0060 family
MFLLQTAGLFILTALAKIVGCFLPYLWLRKGGSIWLLVPAALSLAIFSWLLTLHPAALLDSPLPSLSGSLCCHIPRRPFINAATGLLFGI